MPKISIIVPLYNTPEKFLREMVDSVRAQSYSNWQLVLADASDRDCPYISRTIDGYKDSRIVYKKLDENKGISANTNAGFALADGDYLALVEPRVKAALGKNFSVYRSEPFFLEVLPKGIDKALSLERLLGKIGMKREEMIACGDGYNDLSMIEFAGLGVAMENAVLPVRKIANYITDSNNDDGVGKVVEKFMLCD